jgi:hypothetical protein
MQKHYSLDTKQALCGTLRVHYARILRFCRLSHGISEPAVESSEHSDNKEDCEARPSEPIWMPLVGKPHHHVHRDDRSRARNRMDVNG